MNWRLEKTACLSMHALAAATPNVRLLGFALVVALGLVLSCLAARQAQAAIGFVQQNSAVPQSPQSTVSVAFATAQTAGNLNIVVVGWNDSTAAVSTVTDSKGNVYTRAVGPTTRSGQLSQSIYYAKNIVGAGANTNIVTVQFIVPANFADIRILEYSGLDQVNPVDVTAAAMGTNATSSSGAKTTTNANDLIFGANMVATSTRGPGTGFTSRVITSPNGDIAEDRMVSTAGSYTASAPLNSAGPWVMQMVAFRASSGAVDTQAPTAPSNLVATVVSGSQINLSWTASTDNVGVTGYRVERCQGTGCANFAQIATPTGTTANDTGLTAGTSYSYRVRATDAVPNLSPYSNVASATTPTSDTQPPTAPSNLAATAASGSQINLSWTASTDNVGVTGYRLERCQGAGCSNFAQIAAPTGTTANDTGLTASTSYSYRVRATDAIPNLSPYSNVASATTPTSDTQPPTAPSNLAATAASGSQINLSWTASTDNVGVTGYRLERCQGAGCSNFAQIAAPTGTTANDTGLTASTSYSYRVRATDAVPNLSPYSNVASATTPASDTQPPTAPSNLAATAASGSQINLSWTASTDNVGVTGYRLERCQGAGCTSFAQIATPTGTTANDTGLTAGTSYSYRVRATDAAAHLSTYSNVASAATPSTMSGLAAGWNFNEGAGSIAHDISGNNNTASLTNVSAWSAGEYGGGISFASANFLTVPNSPSLDIAGNALTLSLWLNLQPLAGGDRVVIGKFWNTTWTSPFYQYGLELDGGSTPHFYVGTAGGLVGAAMGSALPFGWNHLAVVFNGLQVQFYLNSALVSTQPLSASITARGNQMRIGADANGTQIFNGAMDDMRVYARVLTQLDIQVDMDTPLGGPSGSDTTPPTVSITFPANNAQLNDIITVTADAADNIGVAGVQFLVDGMNVGAEDGTPPYGLSWDTRTATNGAHTLTARARDTSGNVTFSAPVIVNVANTNFFQNEILATGFTLPTSIKFLPDGRMLVVELPGTIKVLPPPYTQPDPTPFLALNLNITGYAGLQQGIFDIALDPNFATNHYYYIFYTNDSPNRDRLSRFTANATLDGTVSGSEVILYADPQDANTEHHGGAVNFGNDGKIYFTTGEHFNAGDAQLLSNPRGKIHRINPDGTIPTDNPFYDGAGPHWDSIWALGLRNPYRAYYDAPTGRLFVGDVGGNDNSVAKEEVNVGAAGANYGWPNSEGPCAAPCTSPIYYYPHSGRDAAVTGGFVYHGTQFPSAYQGNYFFADYTQNWIRRLTFDANGNVNGVFNFEPANGSADGPYGDIVYLTEGPDGALYYVDLGYSDVGGTFGISKIRRIRYLEANQAPVAVASATPTKGPEPLTVTFSSNGSLDPEGQPLSYIWTFGDGTTSTAANPTHTYTHNGQYTVRLSVSDGVNTTLATPLFISVGNPPSVTISPPQNGIFFRAGDVIAFSGDATDVEDGNLPASAFTWTIDFLHAGHVHPGAPQTGIKNGTFTIPTTGHDFSGDTRYRIMLTVTDSDGLQTSQAVLIYPDKVNLTFDTAPTGLTLYLDGIAKTASFVYDTLPGFNHTIEARDQIQATTSYIFASWSDGGAQQHGIVVPSTAQSYTATYIAAPILLPQGLVAAWNFSEGTGTSASDGSGNGNTATLINGPTWTAGQYDTGLSFNGINNYLTVPNSPSLDISGNALTLTMWINPQSLGGGDSVVLGKFWNTTMTSPYYQYGLELTGGSEPFFYVGTSTGVLVAQMGSSLSFGLWRHLAIVFNGAQVQFYVNGLPVSTQPLVASIQARGNPLNIGADSRPSQFHKGLLDEVRIYNRALTPSEIQTDMTTALPSRF